MIILHYHNVLDSGIEWSLVYNEKYDGPISLYENSENVTIKYI
jgi:hypothetical protein